MIHRLISVPVALLSVFVAGCFPALDATPAEVEVEIREVLRPGDSAETIEEYFRIRGLDVTYDKYQNRYSSIIRHPGSSFYAITI